MKKMQTKNEHCIAKKIAEMANQAAIVAKEVADRAQETAQKVVDKASETAEKVLLFSQSIENIQRDIREINVKLDNKYVTADQFNPVRNIAYGLVGLIMLSVVGAIMTLVLIK